ncbi:MAG TPA: sulfatase-like hydrolase/transferase, partial [Thermoguttaceae bacterium]|nr:sulfatase-like hydrolase/transferase [Thermoguttaceae bacterium]
ALNSPHTPIVPSTEWQGKSGLGDYGDFVMETDWAVGEVLAALDKAGIAENTLVFFASDNGCSPAAGMDNLEKQGHFPSAQFRGHKADIWDGGHRIPFIARWPGHVPPGTTTDQLVCLTDLMATCAAILNVKLPENAAEDSVSLLPVLLGQADAPVREAVVHHSISGKFAIRQGPWKFELCSGSGGWSKGGDGEPVQLYDMAADPGEQKNLHKEKPEIVEQLTKLLAKYVAEGRSTPGTPQKNDTAVDFRKSGGNAKDGGTKGTGKSGGK